MKQREIKFRAWDTEAEEFVDDFILDRLGNYYETNKCEFWGDDRKLILMQYTGIKDRNGRDIYEGDLLKFNPHSDLLLVEFRDGAFGAVDLTCPANGWSAFCDKNPLNASEWAIISHVHEKTRVI